MKSLQKLIIASIMLVCITTTTNAQNGTGFGLKGGLNYGGNGDYFESISDNSQEPDKNIGYHIGVFGKIGDKIYLKPELVYTKLKSNYKNGNFDMSKLDLPLLAGIKVLGPVSVFAGPSFQYILDTDFDGFTVSNVENDFTVGLNFGIGLSFDSIGIDLRYERSFSKNEVTILDTNNLTVNDRLDTRPEQLILSLSIKI